ncbi:MAG: hypothetical protein HW405_947 [Candidatus Berkelbacteria bacterium]|nr:hypothetical protein [Candidatus Berkelbacteria bacterium]
MYDIHDAPVFKITFNVLRDTHLLRGKFPKSEKYALGGRIEDALLAVLTAIIEAGRAKREFKIAPIEYALLKIEIATILIRLAREISILQEKEYLDLIERLDRAGKMLGGWRRSL